MSAVIKTIKDFFGNITYPITKTNAVYDSNNNRLDNVLASKQDASSNFVYKGTGSATPSIDDPELRQSDISTTQSTSDTTVPSSSLVKTMNDNLGNPSSASAVTGADAFSKISKLNSDLASLSASSVLDTNTLKASGINSAYGAVTKIGKLVIVSLSWQGNISGTSPIITLPVGYRPAATSYGAHFLYLSAAAIFFAGSCIVDPDGTLKDGTTSNAKTSGTLNVAFIAV